MRTLCRYFVLALLLLATAHSAFAQNVISPYPSSGVPVGKPLLTSTGTNITQAAPKAGKPIGFTGLDGKPISTAMPPGTPIDMKNLAAPLPAPLADSSGAKSIFESVYDKWRQAIGLSKPTTVASSYTPGLSRRNRERRTSMWRWD